MKKLILLFTVFALVSCSKETISDNELNATENNLVSEISSENPEGNKDIGIPVVNPNFLITCFNFDGNDPILFDGINYGNETGFHYTGSHSFRLQATPGNIRRRSSVFYANVGLNHSIKITGRVYSVRQNEDDYSQGVIKLFVNNTLITTISRTTYNAWEEFTWTGSSPLYGNLKLVIENDEFDAPAYFDNICVAVSPQ